MLENKRTEHKKTEPIVVKIWMFDFKSGINRDIDS